MPSKDLFQMNRWVKATDIPGGVPPVINMQGGPKLLVNFLPADEAGIFRVDNQPVEIKNDGR
jgi:hypothetical protein